MIYNRLLAVFHAASSNKTAIMPNTPPVVRSRMPASEEAQVERSDSSARLKSSGGSVSNRIGSPVTGKGAGRISFAEVPVDKAVDV